MEGNLSTEPQRGNEAKEAIIEEEARPFADKLGTMVVTEASVEFYQYQPLQASDAIRMVELLPGLPQEPIRVALHHRTLSDLPTCSAVSYEWGSNIREHEVQCEGHILKVTANLSLLLSKFRADNSTRLLWIDAICINQDDVDERSRQVLLMGKIYKNAAQVLLWIGDENVHTRDALPVIHGLAERKNSLSLKPGCSEDELLPFERLSDLGIDEWTRDITRPASSQAFNGLNHLLSSTYFTRLWIIQEIVLSSKATVVCGQHKIEWKSLYDATMFIWYCEPLQDAMKNVQSAQNVFVIVLLGELRFKSSSLTMRKMSGIINLFQNARATDPRDYIYGFLGILESRSLDHKIEVDYSSIVEEVFQGATANIITREQDLGLLSRECVEPRSRPRATMPSWVRSFGFYQPQFFHPDISDIELNLGRAQNIAVEDDYLNAHGLITDSIEQVSENFTAKNVKRIVLQAFTNRLSVFSETTRTDIVTAARETFQSIDYKLLGRLPEQSFFNLLSSWLLEDLGLTPHVLTQNPKLRVLATTNSSLRRLFSDDSADDKYIMDLIQKDILLRWSIEHQGNVDDVEKCYSDLTFKLFSKDPALGVNMFRGSKGFCGVGPAGRNDSLDDPPAVQVGDHIALCPTMGPPMIIRDRNDGSYTLVGTAHVGNLLEIPWYEGESPELVPLRLR